MDEFYTRSGILEATITAFMTWLECEYKKYNEGVLTVKMTRNTSDMRQLSRGKAQKASDEAPVFGQEDRDKTVEYPFLRMALAEIAIDQVKPGFKKNRANNGIVIGTDKANSVAITDTMIPVKLSCGMRLETANIDQVIVFAHQLFHGVPVLSLKLVMETGFVVETSANLEGSLTVPSADMSAPGDPFILETTVVFNSYIGKVTKTPLIKMVEVSTVDPDSRTLSSLKPMAIYAAGAETSRVFQKYRMSLNDLFDTASSSNKYGT